jgi:hypothetical protein
MHRGFGGTMIEEFLNMTLHLLRGQVDIDEPTKAG